MVKLLPSWIMIQSEAKPGFGMKPPPESSYLDKRPKKTQTQMAQTRPEMVERKDTDGTDTD